MEGAEHMGVSCEQQFLMEKTFPRGHFQFHAWRKGTMAFHGWGRDAVKHLVTQGSPLQHSHLAENIHSAQIKKARAEQPEVGGKYCRGAEVSSGSVLHNLMTHMVSVLRNLMTCMVACLSYAI